MKQLVDQSEQIPNIEEFHKNKYSFIVAFLAVVLALSIFKEGLRSVPVDLHFIYTDLYQASVPFVCVLGLSAYLYALSLVSAKFYKKFGRFLGRVADIVYMFGIVYPLLVGATWGVAALLSLVNIPVNVLKPTSVFIAIVSAIASLVFTSWQASRQYKWQLREDMTRYLHLAEKYEEHMDGQFEDDRWASSLGFANTFVKLDLQGLLLLYRGEYVSFDLEQLVKAAKEAELINKKQAKVIIDANRAQLEKRYTRATVAPVRKVSKDLFKKFIETYSASIE